AVAAVHDLGDGARHGLPETGPAAPGIELGAGVEQVVAAADAVVTAAGPDLLVPAGERALGMGAAGDVEGTGFGALGRQNGTPFGAALVDGKVAHGGSCRGRTCSPRRGRRHLAIVHGVAPRGRRSVASLTIRMGRRGRLVHDVGLWSERSFVFPVGSALATPFHSSTGDTPMQGQMQSQPLLISSLIVHAE